MTPAKDQAERIPLRTRLLVWADNELKRVGSNPYLIELLREAAEALRGEEPAAALAPQPSLADFDPYLVQAAALCESEARRWANHHPKTAEHWDAHALKLRALALIIATLPALPAETPSETPRFTAEQVALVIQDYSASHFRDNTVTEMLMELQRLLAAQRPEPLKARDWQAEAAVLIQEIRDSERITGADLQTRIGAAQTAPPAEPHFARCVRCGKVPPCDCKATPPQGEETPR